MGMWKSVDRTEKRVLLIASLVSIGHLFLISYAAMFLHISVPTCQPNEKLFTNPELRTVGDHRIEVHYVARMWNFEPKKLVVPVGSTVDFFLASVDVNHGFHINDTNINLMAVPGVVNKGTHTFNKPGLYHLVCHEYCGFGHQNMNATIEVSDKVTVASMDQPDQDSQAVTELSAAAAAGKLIYQQKGCVACHSINGTSGVGPTFKGLWGRTEEMQDGLKVVVDEKYVVESIKMPQAKIVKGFGPVMPALGLSDQEISDIIEFIKATK